MKLKSTFRHFLALAGSSLLAVSSASATNYYWDNNGATGGFGTATGTWAEPTASLWNTNSGGGNNMQASLTTLIGDAVFFGTDTVGLGAGTITVSGEVDVRNITFGAASGSIVLSGDTINLDATSIITTNNASNTISSVLSGAGTSLTKAGTGTLVLTGANTYSGATVINGGTLDLGGSGTTGSLASTVLTLSGGNFSFTRSDSATQNFTTTNINSGGASQISVVAGNTLNLGTVARVTGVAFDFASTGSGTVAADTANNTGGIMAGFTFGDTWAVANGAGNAITGLANESYTATTGLATNAYAGNIDVDSSDATPDADITVNSLRFSEGAANTVTLSGTNTITTGGILVGSGVGGNLSTITGGTLVGAASKDLAIIQNNTSGGLAISSVIADNGGATALAKSGAGLLTLSGNNTFTGGLLINAGEVLLNNAGALNSASGSENAVTFAAGSTGTLSLNGNSVVVRSLNGTSGTVQNASASAATLTIGNSGNQGGTFTGVIQDGTGGGALSLTKAGTGTLILSGTGNTYSGTTTISAGTLQGNKSTPGGPSPFGTSTIQLNAGTLNTFTISATDTAETYTFGNDINVGGNASIFVSRSGGVGSAKTHAYGNLSIGSNTLSLTASNINHTLSFTGANLTGDAIINNGTNATTNIGAITETGGPRNLTKQGVATLRLTGTNTYTGTTTISGGTLEVQGSIASSGITNNATLTFNSASAQSYGNVISGSGALTKTGAGTLTLSNNNTFTGNVTVGGSGTLVLSGINSYTGTTNIGGGSSSGPGTLSVNSVSDYGVASAIGAASSGAINFNSNANNTSRLVYTGTGGSMNRQFSIGLSGDNVARHGGINNDGSGALILTASTFNVAIAGTTATRTLTLGGTYTGSANEIQGVIQNNATGGAINLTKSGSGTWKLSGANTYTGVTSVGANGGILQFGKVNSLYNGNTASWTAANIRVANGGTLAFNVGGTGEFTSTDVDTLFTNLANSTNATTNGMASGSRFGFDTTNASGGSFEISQVVADSGGTSGGARGLTKLGTSTLVLSNTNTYTGATTVSGGTLTITGPTQATSSITFTGGSLGLDTGFPVTASSAAVNLANGTITVTGSTGAPSYTLLTAASITGTPVLASPVSGYELQLANSDTELRLVQTGSSSPYDTWSGGAAFDADANGDGVDNGLAFLLGASGPNVSALDKLPTVTQSGGGLVLTFQMLPSSARGGAALSLEHSNTLGSWTTVTVPDTSSTVSDVVFNVTGTNPLNVTATIPVSKAAGGKLFGRVKAVNP